MKSKAELNDFIKAEQFNSDAKVSLLSLRDAIKAAHQISIRVGERAMLGIYFSRFTHISSANEMFIRNINNGLGKKNTNNALTKDEKASDVSNNNEIYDNVQLEIISCNSKDALYVFNLYKDVFNFYSKYISMMDEARTFHQLNNKFITIEKNLRQDLKSELVKVKKNFISREI